MLEPVTAAIGLGDLSDDGFLNGRLKILQPRTGFRAAVDSVLLPAAVMPANGLDILDAGIGAGVATLCLLARAPNFRAAGIEIQSNLATLATENARRNGFSVDIQCRDFLATGHGKAFDQVMINPPYQEPGKGTRPPDRAKAIAHVGSAAGDMQSLARWIASGLAHLKPNGTLTLIHRADRLDTILAALDRAAGDVMVLPLIPREGAPPGRVVVRATLGAMGGLRTLPGLVLHGSVEKYTPEAEAILRHGAAIDWDRGGIAESN